jgi:Cysteine-rich secretory protein family
MSLVVRLFTVIVVVASTIAPELRAQTSAADVTLLNAANHDREAAGLQPLKWDDALAAAAHKHALLMAKANTLSHQFPGEPPLQDRARQAGSRFSTVAENVAQGPSVPGLHTQWMNSAPHRANLLDPQLNAVGIAVVQSGNQYFAVQDFADVVPSLSLKEQEHQIAAQLSELGLQNVSASADGRKTCELDRGFAGTKPATVLRYETSDLSHLPEDVSQKISSGKFHTAAVGACEANSSSDFARYRVAILLF